MSVQVAVFNKRSCPVGNVQHDWTLTKEGRKYCVQGQNERGVFDSKKEAVQSLANKVKQMTFVFDFQTQGSLEKNLHDLYVWNRLCEKNGIQTTLVGYLGQQEDVYHAEWERFAEQALALKNVNTAVATAKGVHFSTQLDAKLVHQRKQLMDDAFAFTRSEVLGSALAIGVFEKLENKSLMARELGLEENFATDLLDMLVAMDLLRKTAGKYTNSPIASEFLVKGKPNYLGHYQLQIWKDLIPLWHERLTARLTTDGKKPDELVRQNHPDTNWATAMESLSCLWAEALSHHPLFQQHNQLTDLGSARGLVSRMLAEKHPHLHVTLVDKPETEQHVQDYFPASLKPRMNFVGGDLLQMAAYPKSKILLLGHLLHNFNEGEIRTILKKSTAALEPGGTLIVTEYFVDNDRCQHIPGMAMSLNMRIYHPNAASDYTKEDLKKWLQELSVYGDMEIVKLTEEHSALLAVKKQ